MSNFYLSSLMEFKFSEFARIFLLYSIISSFTSTALFFTIRFLSSMSVIIVSGVSSILKIKSAFKKKLFPFRPINSIKPYPPNIT
ncbi:hypothetical protein FC92_GL001212 [Liquorilactobacillus hordei DSM 19519]|uniref:Uncharacterized protein n=1 Tax=Liquorilactobacillus hordei DSM 19519 TaxID=1423759 RepID=A0A0R1MDD2_9LACO|nr:hypothetical protein FC92_GL001212 [Liquorilactobacillus hordei DSM 19519]